MVDELRAEVRNYLVEASENTTGDPTPFTREAIEEKLSIQPDERLRLKKALDSLATEGVIKKREHHVSVYVLTGKSGRVVSHALSRRLGSSYSSAFLVAFVLVLLTYVLNPYLTSTVHEADPIAAYRSGVLGGFAIGGIGMFLLAQMLVVILSEVVRWRIRREESYRTFVRNVTWSAGASGVALGAYVAICITTSRVISPGEAIGIVLAAIAAAFAGLALASRSRGDHAG